VPSKTSLKNKDYVHLHNHTEYSLLDGLTKINPLIELVAEQKMDAVAITDHGTLSGAIEFYKSAKAKSIKPIIGIETYVASRKHTDKDPSKDKNRFHLILLAIDNTGYQNLMRLSTIANLDGYYYFPRIDHDLLEKYNEGIICLSGCMGGEIGNALKEGQVDQATEIAKWYKNVFGDRYYLEIQDSGHPKNPMHNKEQEIINNQILKLGKDLSIPVVLTCDAHYLKHEDQEAHETLLCVGTASYLSQTNRMSLKDFPLHVIPPAEIINRWGESNPEVIINTKKIADRVNVNIEFDKILIPKTVVPKGKTESEVLHEIVFQGLAWRYRDYSIKESQKLNIKEARKLLSKEILDRTDYELNTIDKMGFNGYFLIVQDFIRWGKDKGIIFGPGRGSAAGSIVAYATRITEIEPLKYNLMFERFLNPGRISMPDIDIDIQDTRRDEVIKYCVDKYGSDRVANIVTFGRMAARNAVRDVSRVLEVPYSEADRLAKMLPAPIQGRHIPLRKSIQEDPDLKAEYDTNSTSKRVLDLAIQLEGTIRSHGVHAAGVVIAPDDIVKFVPLEMAQKGVVATQYSMNPIEELGLLKMDFLGLSNLTVINNAMRIVRKVYKTKIELNEIPNDDQKTFELLKNANTTGVFQLESAGMKRYLKELQPTQFDDIIAMVALYRPGPMSEIPRFIEGKNNPAKVTYLHKALMPVLHDTYGVMVYQDQITQLLQLIAGYTPGEADLVRKAIGKKKRDIMEAEEPRFLEGCVKQGLTENDAKKLWAQIQPFADYSFNKAHAACYAQISYWTAYLKVHYPDAFMAALMTSDYDNIDRLSIEIAECQHMNVEVLSPDINESFYEFAIVPGKSQIRFGLIAIKNVGSSAVDDILAAREAGPFTSLEDFFSRVNSRVVNRKTLESLIKSGAFDRFGERSYLLNNLDVLLAFSSKLSKDKNSGQVDLFADLNGLSTLPNIELKLDDSGLPATQQEKLAWERELLGLYLSEHPLDAYRAILADKTVPIDKIQPEHHNKNVTVGGAISTIRGITTKNGQKMAFVKIEDHFGEIELVFFPSVYTTYAAQIERDKVYVATGKLSTRDRSGNVSPEPKILVDSIIEISSDELKNFKPKKLKKIIANPTTLKNESSEDSTIEKRLFIRLANSQNQELLKVLKKTIDENDGQTDVLLVLGSAEDKQVIKLPMKINYDETSISKLTELVGAENIKLH
jgi:DNA polymerase III subunit alpha